MKLPRLRPDTAYLVNTMLSKGEIPKWATPKIQKQAQEESWKLLDEYLKQKSFDIYLALSLRSLDDFIRGEQIAALLENQLRASVVYAGGLGVDKNTPDVDASNEKGDLERFFLNRSRSLLMLDAEKPTWGKFVEAATMMIAQKPVVVLTESDETAFVLKDRHPLKTLGGWGGASGYHVVASLNQATHCLSSELNDESSCGLIENLVKDATTKKRRSSNFICPHCGSLIRRISFWLYEMKGVRND